MMWLWNKPRLFCDNQLGVWRLWRLHVGKAVDERVLCCLTTGISL